MSIDRHCARAFLDPRSCRDAGIAGVGDHDGVSVPCLKPALLNLHPDQDHGSLAGRAIGAELGVMRGRAWEVVM
jgi:hypothetical protein